MWWVWLHDCERPVLSLSSITVVQSYFVHWAGIESLVVRDQSRGSGNKGNITAMVEWSLASLLQERLRDKTTGPSMTLEPTATTSRASQSYDSQETPTAFDHPVLERIRSVTLASPGDLYLQEQQVTETNSSVPFGPHQSVTTSRLVSGVTQEASNHSSTGLPVLTVPNSKTAPPLLPVRDSTMKQEEEKTTSQDLKVSSVSRLKDTLGHHSTSKVFLLKTVHHSNSAGSTPVPQTGQWNLPSKSWISQTKSESSLIQKETNTRSTLQALNPHSNFVDHSQRADQQQTPSTSIFHLQTATNLPGSTSQTSSQDLVHPTKPPSLDSTLVEAHPSLLELLSALSHHRPSSYLTKHSEYSPSEPTTRLKQTSKNQHLRPTDATSTSSPEPPRGFLQTLTQTPQPQKQTQTSGAPQTFLTARVHPASTLKKVVPTTSPRKIENPNFASTPAAAPLSTLKSLLSSTTNASLHHSSFTTSLHPPGPSTVVSKQTFSPHESGSSSTTPRNQPKTPPALSALPSPSPISTPPHMALLQPFSSSSIPVSSLKPPSGSPHYQSPVHVRTSPSFTTSQHITSSTPSTRSPATISVTASTLTPSLFSVGSLSPTSLLMSSGSTSSHPEPAPVPSRSLSQAFTSPSFSGSHQQLPKDRGSLIQDPTAPSESQPKLNALTPTMMVHPNPEPHPNFDSHLKANINKLKPHPPDTDTEPEHPTNPSRTPGKEGTFPDIIPRHSTWELGMLLGCSAGLGMVLVVGLRYMYSQACGKRTDVTLNDRERECARGERGLIHVQECGDLVRVRRIRDNSFVFLAEYDILTSPGDWDAELQEPKYTKYTFKSELLYWLLPWCLDSTCFCL